MIITDDGLTFETTGRSEYAHARIVGINPDLDLSYGYDGDFNDRSWKVEEKVELALHMIELWTKYLDRYKVDLDV